MAINYKTLGDRIKPSEFLKVLLKKNLQNIWTFLLAISAS